MKKILSDFEDFFRANAREINALDALFCTCTTLKGFSKYYKVIIFIAMCYGYKYERVPHSVGHGDGFLLRN
jgi:hypothetical protein